MVKRAVLGLGVLMAAAACEPQNNAAPPAEPEAAAAPFVDVTAPYETPFADERVSGAAFWADPALSFRSVIAAIYERQALVLFDTELSPLDQRGGAWGGGLALAYGLDGGEALLAAHDDETGAFRFFTVDAEDRVLVDLNADIKAKGPMRDICLSSGDGGAFALHAVTQRGTYYAFDLETEAGNVASRDFAEFDNETPFTACAVDNDAKRLYLGQADGRLLKADLAATEFVLELVDAKGPETISGLALLAQGDGAGRILAANGDSGYIHVFDKNDYAFEGAFRVIDAFDVDAVDEITALSAFGGNLGGIYRNGVIAVGDGRDDQGANLKLVPWSAVANALGVDVGAAVSPRGQAAIEETDDDGVNIQLDGVPAEIMGEAQSGGENE
ncbi:MAG: phytase [Pseudomonadota bacterium]